jgi:phosphoribosylglycinamide formyltransferase-1
MKKINLAVLISGRGSNLRAIIESIESGYLDNVNLKVVIANKEAQGLKYADDFGVPTFVIPRIVDGVKIPIDEHDDKVLALLEKFDIDLICLAGYLQVLQSKFVRKYMWRIMNIHPSLLPAFGGTIHGQKDALEYGAKITGCTVHFIDEGVDSGPIIIQAAVPVKEDDDEDSLSRRILEFEHIIYPKAIKMFAENRLEIKGRRVEVKYKIEIESLTSYLAEKDNIIAIMKRIGVSENIYDGLLQKMSSFVISVKDLTPREAMIMKQELLAIGGDCAVPRECILNSLVPVNVLVIGTQKQLTRLSKVLENQAWNLPEIGRKIESLMGQIQ